MVGRKLFLVDKNTGKIDESCEVFYNNEKITENTYIGKEDLLYEYDDTDVLCVGVEIKSEDFLSYGVNRVFDSEVRIANVPCITKDNIKISLPDGITVIMPNTFSNMKNLSSLTLPNTVKKIGQYGIYRCNNLITLICKAKNPPDIRICVLKECNSLEEILVPASSVNKYKSARGWSEHADIIKPL